MVSVKVWAQGSKHYLPVKTIAPQLILPQIEVVYSQLQHPLETQLQLNLHTHKIDSQSLQ